MPASMYFALFFTVLLLLTTAYFLLGSVPLLVLKHDTPLDGRFVRGFFNTYYLAAIVTATGTSVSYGLAGRFVFSFGAGALALLAVLLRRQVIGRMDRYRERIQAQELEAIPGFRRTHLTAIALNLAQLVILVWSLTTLTLK